MKYVFKDNLTKSDKALISLCFEQHIRMLRDYLIEVGLLIKAGDKK